MAGLSDCAARDLALGLNALATADAGRGGAGNSVVRRGGVAGTRRDVRGRFQKETGADWETG